MPSGKGRMAWLAIMAASVYILLGVLAALMVHLRNAQDDRVRRPELLVDVDESVSGSQGAVKRALAIVALRSDEPLSSSQDVAVRRTAADLRDVARRALVGPNADQRSVARVEPVTPTEGRCGVSRVDRTTVAGLIGLAAVVIVLPVLIVRCVLRRSKDRLT